MAVLAGVYGKTEPEYIGCTVDMFERNYSSDSYWYAVCWDREKKKLVHVQYDTTAAGGGGWAEIDATEEVLREMYRKYKAEAKTIFDAHGNESQAKKVRLGDTVIVIRGRKVPKATTGKVFWLGKRYNQYRREYENRVGIEKADGEKVFLPEEYVLPVNWKERMMSGKERKEFIRHDAVKAMPIHYQHLFA